MAVKNLNTNIDNVATQQEPSKAPELINQIGDLTWTILDKNSRGGEVKLTMLFDSEGLGKQAIEWMQTCLLHKFPYVDNKYTLQYSKGTMTGYRVGLTKLAIYLNSSRKKLNDWSKKDVIQCLQSHVSACEDEDLISYGHLSNIVRALDLTYQLRNKLSGTYQYQLPSNIMESACREIVEKKGVIYSEWLKGGSFGTVPMEIASLLLADAINTIRSDKAKQLSVYFEHQRTDMKIVRIDCTLFKKSFSELAASGATKNYKYRYQKLQTELEKISGCSVSSFPWKSYKAILFDTKKIYQACEIILLSLTGMRNSELTSMKSDWFEQRIVDGDIHWFFKLDIKKTNVGMGTFRSFAGLCAEVFELLNTLSYIDKPKMGLQLLTETFKSVHLQRPHNSATKNAISKQTVSNNIQDYYLSFVDRMHESIAELHPEVSCHQFRHLFAEFAIRKFDGNVEEAIRHHFMHNSEHTKAYTRDTLNEQEINDINQRYIKELTERFLNPDTLNEYGGSAVLHIRKLAAKLLNNKDITLATPKEIAKVHEQIQSRIVSVTGHEYGMCVLLKSKQTQAKCRDKGSILPNVGGNAEQKKCFGCVNYSIHHKSHAGNLMHTKQRHLDFANNELLASFPMVEVSKRIVKQIDKHLAQVKPANGS